MLNRQARLIGVIAAVVMMAAGSIASAATITFGPDAFGTFTAGAGGPVSLPSFNSTLGTLTGVELLVTGSSNDGSNSLQNVSDNAGTASVTIGTSITVSGPSSLTVLTLPSSSNSGPVTANVNTPPNFTGSDAIVVDGSLVTASNNSSMFTGLAAYETVGPGSVPFTYSSSADTASSASVSPTITETTPPSFGFDATVVYTYNAAVGGAVPEPSSVVALCGLGAMGLLLAVRRCRRTA